jgi:hypothetical protein
MPGRASAVLGQTVAVAGQPSQFWFMQVLYLGGALLFGYLAWREYNG